MHTLKKQLKQNLIFLLFSTLFFVTQAMAETDLTAQKNFLRARAENAKKETDHADHANHADPSQKFHGIFYGFVPCEDCPGIKMTLSLKQNNNYLLVYQYSRESSREFYEKGKYNWNDENHILVLTPRKAEAIRQYLIENDETIVQLNEGGTKMTGEQAERYVLNRSDKVKSREVHLH